MIIQIKIEKKHFYFLVALVTVFFIIGVNAAVNSGQIVGHSAEEVVAGTFGPGDYVFQNNLNVNQNLYGKEIIAGEGITLGGERKTTWPDLGKVIWNLPADNISSGTFGSNVGSGNYVFPSDLRVNNNAQVLGTLDSKDVVVGGNLSLGGEERDTWPKENSELPADNISSGTFGSNVGGGDYIFPGKIGVTGLDPTTNSKGWDWGMGLHTWDVFAEASVWASTWIGTDGDLYVGRNITLGGVRKDHWPSTGLQGGCYYLYTVDATACSCVANYFVQSISYAKSADVMACWCCPIVVR